MKLFLSYAHEQAGIARDIEARLSADEHDVFFDRATLRVAESYDDAIRREVEACDAFLFLISPEAIANGKYTLSELAFMKRKHRNPSGKVLPVMVKPVLFSLLDPYLRAVTVLVPEGDVAAEVVAAVSALSSSPGLAESAALDAQVLNGRIEAYKKLWALTQLLPKWPRDENITYDGMGAFSKTLRKWYFNDGGGLFLSRPAYGFYATVQAGIAAILANRPSGAVSNQHYDAVRELCSTLRRQLAADLGTRIKQNKE